MSGPRRFQRTAAALIDCQSVLTCDKCQQLGSYFESIAKCAHTFCKNCADEILNSNCPVCGTKSFPKDRVPCRLMNEMAAIVGDISKLVENKNAASAITPTSETDEFNTPSHSNFASKAVSVRRPVGNTEPCGDQVKKSEGKQKRRSAPAKDGHVSSTRKKTDDDSFEILLDNAAIAVNLDESKEINETIVTAGQVNFGSVVHTVPKVNKRDSRGNSTLQRLCLARDEKLDQVKEIILQQHINPNQQDNMKWTPLHEAVANEHNKIVEVLLSSGAIVDAPGGDEFVTPLHEAILSNQLETAEILLKYGANPEKWNIFGKKSIDMCTSNEMRQLISGYIDQWNKRKPQETSLELSTQKVAPIFNDSPPKHMFVVLSSAVMQTHMRDVNTLRQALTANAAPMENVVRGRGRPKRKVPQAFEFLEEVDERATHLIVPSRHCRRTLKFFAAVSLPCWVVTADWIEASAKAGRMVDAAPFEVAGTAKAPQSNGPQLARLNSLWFQPPLFTGIWIFCRKLNPAYKVTFERIILKAGAKFASREPHSDSDLLQEHNTFPYHADLNDENFRVNFLIVYDPILEKMENNLKGLLNTDRIRTVPTTWLYDCLESFKILPFPL